MIFSKQDMVRLDFSTFKSLPLLDFCFLVKEDLCNRKQKHMVKCQSFALSSLFLYVISQIIKLFLFGGLPVQTHFHI